MHDIRRLIELVTHHATQYLFLGVVVARFAVGGTPKGSEARSRARFATFLFVLHCALLLASFVLAEFEHPMLFDLRVLVSLSSVLAGVVLASVIVFEGLVRRWKPALPRIIPDVLTAMVAFAALMRASARLGIELSGVIATSAVLTAVIGLALQDTIGNVFSGLALQLDQSIQVGDWVKIGDITGKIVEIRWRYAAIETRNWETVIIPNGVITKAQVSVLGKRQGRDVQWRRWLYFQVDFRHTPNEVIEVVERALRAQPIANVASDPPPNCIAMDLGDSAIKYAVRYWLTDLAHDDPTDSLVRTRIFFALARAHIQPSIPAQAVFVTHEDKARAESKQAADYRNRVAALSRVELFRGLGDDERAELATSLHRAPFARGETLTREGADAHHLYTILSGEVSVRVGGTAEANEVARLGAGDFFGEMALLTGEKRRATSVALTDVECFRLDASAFRAALGRRPDLAEHVAKVLAEREAGLSEARERVDSAERARRIAESESAFLGRIKAFFDLA